MAQNVTMPEILSALASHGGEIQGSGELYAQVNSVPRAVRENLVAARQQKIIRTIYPEGYGGRGHKARHCLTHKGWILLRRINEFAI